MSGIDSKTIQVAEALEGQTLGAVLREVLDGQSWSAVRRLVATGKVFVDGARCLDAATRVDAGATVEIDMNAPRPDKVRNQVDVRHLDAHVAVIEKPVGLASVPYGDQEPDNALEAVRQLVRRRQSGRPQVGIVHRLDKATSGVMVFPLSHRARTVLADQWRAHEITRRYRCVVHGHPESQRIESRLVTDRGDGLRGSTRDPDAGKLAVSHLTVVERLEAATLCDVRLETGRTHQIRIHLSELGHPLVGEPVYIRDFVRAGGTPLRSSRLLLHAAELGFAHPRSGQAMHFDSRLPRDFVRELDRLR